MRISRIRIENFRNFSSLDVSLGEHAVIVGENKIGKSNLLFALQLVLDPSLPETVRQLRLEDFWDGLERPLKADSKIEISIEFADFEDDEDQLAILAEHLIAPAPMTARLTFVFQPKPTIEGDPTNAADFEYVIYGGDRPDNIVGSDVRRRIPMTLLPALRDAENDLASWRKSPLRPLLDTAVGEIDTEELDRVAGEVAKASEAVAEIEEIKSVTRNLTDKLVEMVGDWQALETALGISPTDPDRLIRSLRLFIDGGDRPIADASLGSSNLIYLALKSLELEQLVETRDRDHTFLAIEEPEAHLHPHLQRLVYRDFLRPRDHADHSDEVEVANPTTILLTTHSPHIVSVAPLKSLIVLKELSGVEGTAGCSTANIALEDNDIGDLERYLDVSRGEMLFAKGVLLVEGDAEVFVVPALAKLLGIDLDKKGISVSSVSGTHFGAYVRFLGTEGINTPFAVLTDFDPRTNGSNYGVSRITKLLGILDEDLELEVEEDDAIIESAKDYGIFLNEHTFEIDLFKCGRHTSICNTLVELGPGQTAKDRARGWKDDPDSLDEDRFLKDIDAIGKGRFAQRLCSHLRNRNCPTYIKEAIKYVVDKCE